MDLGALVTLFRRIVRRDGRGTASPRKDLEAVGATAQVTGPLRVVLVEDNANLRISLRLALELDGLTVVEAPDGEAGLEAILRERPDVAVVDLSMPRLDGLEVARRLRSHRAALRLIALSGHSAAAELDAARAAGFDLVVGKPIDPERLARLIRGASA